MIVALTVQERVRLLQVLDDPPAEFATLRQSLLEQFHRREERATREPPVSFLNGKRNRNPDRRAHPLLGIVFAFEQAGHEACMRTNLVVLIRNLERSRLRELRSLAIQLRRKRLNEALMRYWRRHRRTT